MPVPFKRRLPGSICGGSVRAGANYGKFLSGRDHNSVRRVLILS